MFLWLGTIGAAGEPQGVSGVCGFSYGTVRAEPIIFWYAAICVAKPKRKRITLEMFNSLNVANRGQNDSLVTRSVRPPRRGNALAWLRPFVSILALLCVGSSSVHADTYLDAQVLTRAVMSLVERIEDAPRSDRAALERQLLMVLEARRAKLRTLVDSNPEAFIRLALPIDERDDIRLLADGAIESRFRARGRLEIVNEDAHGPARVRYNLVTPEDRVSLHFSAQAPVHLHSGADVLVEGLFLDGAVALSSTQGAIVPLDRSSSRDISLERDDTTGEQKTAVLLVKFAEDGVVTAFSPDDAQRIVFEEVNDFLIENSFGHTWLSGEVEGWYTLDMPRTCSREEIASAADFASGIDPRAYDRLIYVLPRNDACPWSGAGTIGGYPSRAWINGELTLNVVAHELGHNFGLFHSNALECDSVPFASDCVALDYGDTIDAMGKIAPGHFNAFQKERLGWLDFEATPTITHVEVDGRYTIDAYETPTDSPKALKIARGKDPQTGATQWYYLEYRQAVGFDQFLARRSFTFYRQDVSHGIVVRLGAEDDARSSQLLHMKDEPRYEDLFERPDWLDPALSFGESFNDAQSGLAITPLWADGSQAEVQIELGSQSCLPRPPAVVLKDAETTWSHMLAGAAAELSLEIENRNDASCDDAQFVLDASVAPGWFVEFERPNVVLESGASERIMLRLEPPAGAHPGFYDVLLTASSDDLGIDTVSSVTASYVVTTAHANTPPVAVTDVVDAGTQAAISIDVLANDMDANADQLVIVAVDQPELGRVELNADSTITYFPPPLGTGRATFDYTITDGTHIARTSAIVDFSAATR